MTSEYDNSDDTVNIDVNRRRHSDFMMVSWLVETTVFQQDETIV